MIDRLALGLLADKPHTVLRNDQGELLFEHCHTRHGFDGAFTIAYHQNGPMVDDSLRATERGWARPELQAPAIHRRLFDTRALGEHGCAAESRVVIMANHDVEVGVMRPTIDDEAFVANNDGDELFFIHHGQARLQTSFGELNVGDGDYVWVPRSLPYRFVDVRGPMLIMTNEVKKGLRLPTQYLNPFGQLKLDAPYSHRDFVRPTLPAARSERHEVLVKRRGQFFLRDVPGGVLDVVGFDGFVYPVAFNISRFSPKTGQIHLPPPVHATFAAPGVLFCSFVPRVTDTHEQAIPCPYPHSSVDCDELIFYCKGNFTSRRGVGPGALSLHPAGVPHGPHPGAYEASIGSKRTEELAVMLDTFEPLLPTKAALALENTAYHQTWKT